MINGDLKVSVILPCYNAAQFVYQTVESVLHQSYPVFEIILVNDGSKDDTLSVLRLFALRYSNVTLIDQPNQGVSAARNHGFQHATGELIAFLDSDDLWHPDFVKSAVSSIESGSDFFAAASFRFRNQPGDTNDFFGPNQDFVDRFPLSLVEGNAIVPAMVLMKRSVMEKVGIFEDDRGAWEDWDLWIRAVKSGARFSFDTTGRLVHYRYAPDSRSSYLAIGCERCAGTLLKHENTGIAPRRLFRHYRSMWLRRRGSQEINCRIARRFYLESLVLTPWSLKSWGKWLLSWISLNTQR
jgi:glycosyltransferase involved in cell wall biosynthesis